MVNVHNYVYILLRRYGCEKFQYLFRFGAIIILDWLKFLVNLGNTKNSYDFLGIKAEFMFVVLQRLGMKGNALGQGLTILCTSLLHV
jgi:hypothetical protein